MSDISKGRESPIQGRAEGVATRRILQRGQKRLDPLSMGDRIFVSEEVKGELTPCSGYMTSLDDRSPTCRVI